MKVVIINHHHPDKFIGGAQIFTYDLAAGLANNGIETFYFGGDPRPARQTPLVKKKLSWEI